MKRHAFRLGREERGQVLYLTLVMMLVLGMFSLILANVIYLSVMKVKAQNAVDAMALSAATLKARLLNQMAYVNGLLETGALQWNTVSAFRPYATEVDMLAGQGFMGIAYSAATALTLAHNLEVDRLLDRVALENGIDGERCQVKLNPVDVVLADPYGLINAYADLKVVLEPGLKYFVPPEPVPVPIVAPLLTLTAVEPRQTPWAVQARLSWRTRVLGGSRLGITLPDIVTRARAEIRDEGTASGTTGHDWRVVLAQPDEMADAALKNR